MAASSKIKRNLILEDKKFDIYKKERIWDCDCVSDDETSLESGRCCCYFRDSNCTNADASGYILVVYTTSRELHTRASLNDSWGGSLREIRAFTVQEGRSLLPFMESRIDVLQRCILPSSDCLENFSRGNPGVGVKDRLNGSERGEGRERLTFAAGMWGAWKCNLLPRCTVQWLVSVADP